MRRSSSRRCCWRDELRQRIEALDWDRAQADMRPFLERPRDLDLVTLDALGSLLRQGDERRDESFKEQRS
jgi:hypothetical protein